MPDLNLVLRNRLDSNLSIRHLLHLIVLESKSFLIPPFSFLCPRHHAHHEVPIEQDEESGPDKHRPRDRLYFAFLLQLLLVSHGGPHLIHRVDDQGDQVHGSQAPASARVNRVLVADISGPKRCDSWENHTENPDVMVHPKDMVEIIVGKHFEEQAENSQDRVNYGCGQDAWSEAAAADDFDA